VYVSDSTILHPVAYVLYSELAAAYLQQYIFGRSMIVSVSF